jgi:signal transduction histidine kinase/ActR/RegA family two-component response regulator
VTGSSDAAQEERLLILAPVGKDASLTAAKLRSAGMHCQVCRDIATLAAEIDAGAGAALVAEEALAGGTETLVSVLARQPSWSDLPILLLTRPGADSSTVALAVSTLGNVILLERPIRVSALVSAASTALRARQRQYQSRAQLQSLEEADRRKDEFLATLAHELRNPLAPIRNSVELLRMAGTEQPVVRDLADMMGRQVVHMVRLVDDLLEISRITRGTIELRRMPVQLAAVVASALETSRTMIDASQHRLEVQLPDEDVWLDVDHTRIAQVISNLLNNAAKYTDPGGLIRLTARRVEGEAVIEVQDTGIGIPANLLPRVFDMFAQGDTAASRSPGGLGIGLTLVRSVVEMHGGKVAAYSDGQGTGSLLTVRLPVMEKAHASGPHEPAPKRGLFTSDSRVLVVDDNHDAADSLGALLEIIGAQVAIAHDGPTALAMVQTHRPDIVFLDIGMPQMDGYEVARRIRQLPQAANALLVALTGWGQEKDRLQSEAAGFDRHLVKPADLDTLRGLLAAAGQAHG